MQWLDGRDEDHLFLSSLTIGELQKGVTKLDDGQRRRQLQTWVETELVVRFAGRILAVDTDVASTWGLLQGEALRQGKTLPVIDSLLAATALTHNLTVVTRNTADFVRCQVRLFDPWSD